MRRFHKGRYEVKNPGKYVGTKAPVFRSSWERDFMRFCDGHPSVVQWASEAIRIPYLNPITNSRSYYVPDFLVFYQSKNGALRKEVVEVKPLSQTSLKEARSVADRRHAVVNAAKWNATRQYCAANGLGFRVVTEYQIYRNPRVRKQNRKSNAKAPNARRKQIRRRTP